MSEAKNRCQVARDLLKNGAHLVDVRTEEEFEQEALSGAINIPINILSQVSNMLDKTSNIIVYCGTGI